ncbi:nrm (predicted) [Pycnogonum litorale]
MSILAPPAFIENLPPMSGAKKTAESVSMTCTVECDPPCTVQWLKNGENLQDSDMYVIKTSAQTQNEQRNYFESVVTTLYWNLTAWPNGILQESLVDGANFSCVSSDNAVGPGVSSTTLFRVEYAPEFAEIFPAAVNITEGIVPNDMLRCEASAFPEPNFLWKFGEQVVSSEQTLIMNYNVTRDKHGVYTCIVTNRHGTTQANANVHVLYAPECSISLSEADEDGKVNLTCAADADPSTIDFTWSRDNSTLKVDLHSQLDDPLSFSIIKVRRGDPEYYGQYSCVANNTVGDSNPCSFKITGAAPLLVEEESNILLIIIIVIVLIILIIIIIIIICCCCLRKKKNKDPDDIGQREGPVGKSEPTPPRPADRKPGPGEPVYQNVNKSNAPKLQAMPRNRDKPLYENVPPPNVTPRDGPFRPDDDDLVYADLYDDIKMGKVPDPRKERPPLPPKKSKQKLDENSAADRPSVSRPAPISNGSTAL